jgi:hypothetical protein
MIFDVLTRLAVACRAREIPYPQPVRGANIGCADIIPHARERER